MGPGLALGLACDWQCANNIYQWLICWPDGGQGALHSMANKPKKQIKIALSWQRWLIAPPVVGATPAAAAVAVAVNLACCWLAWPIGMKIGGGCSCHCLVHPLVSFRLPLPLPFSSHIVHRHSHRYRYRYMASHIREPCIFIYRSWVLHFN